MHNDYHHAQKPFAATSHRQSSILTVGIALYFLAGCAADTTLGTVDWEHGARRGHVASTYAAGLPPAQLPKCLANLPPEQYAAHRFVLVRYHHVRVMRSAVAPVTPDLDIRDGDIVELWPADCAAGGLARVTRILSAKQLQ